MRYAFGTLMVALALVLVAGANSAATDFNPDGAAVVAVEGVQFSGTVATFTDPVIGNNNYSAKIDWGDGTTDDGRVSWTGDLAANNHRIYNVTGSHTYTEEGKFAMRVTITGPGGMGQSSPTATVTDAPISVKVALPAVNEGGSVNGPVATITDPNTAEVATAFKATISWGDGTSSTGAIAKTGAGTFSISGSHSFGEESQVTVSVQASDVGGSAAGGTQAVTIADAPLTAGAPITLHAVEGRAAPGAIVAKFTDGFAAAPASDFTATINWGDGTSGPGAISPAPGGGFQVTGGSHTYRDEGQFATSVAVKDKGGSAVTIPGSASVADAAIRAKGVRTEARVGRAFNGKIATFVDGNPKAPLSDYTVRIDWGSGPRSFGTVLRTRNGLIVTGKHTWATAGRKTVTITIVDRGGSRATATSRVVVS